MRHSNQLSFRINFYYIFILVAAFMFSACNNSASEDKVSKTTTVELPKFKNIHWNVKAILPDGQSLDIKAFNNSGDAFDIKAVQDSDQDSFLDVTAFGEGKELPVKILVSSDKFAPVKAIDKRGISYSLKAITAEGEKLDVKGVARFGTIVIIKAISKKGELYGVKAMSPTGTLNDIKGIKINIQDKEMSLKGSYIYAHVKAMHPAADEDNFKVPSKKKVKGKAKKEFKRIIWNIKAVTTDGKNLDIKAFDAEGNAFNVKATQDSKQHSFMNIKAFVNEYELPIKIFDSEDQYAPIKAIGTDGAIYNIKAVTKEGVKLDVKGTSRSGNIINVKAIAENGEFYGVKAFSPKGKLNEVKGIKIFKRKVEMKIKGNPVYGHLKAINQ